MTVAPDILKKGMGKTLIFLFCLLIIITTLYSLGSYQGYTDVTLLFLLQASQTLALLYLLLALFYLPFLLYYRKRHPQQGSGRRVILTILSILYAGGLLFLYSFLSLWFKPLTS